MEPTKLFSFIHKEVDTLLMDGTDYSIPKWLGKPEGTFLTFKWKNDTIILEGEEHINCQISEESGLSILCQQSAGDFLESFFNIDEEETITLPSMLEISKEALKNVECCLSSTWVDGRISCTERIVLAYPGIDESAEKKITIIPGILELERIILHIARLHTAYTAGIMGTFNIGKINMQAYVELGIGSEVTVGIASTEESFPSLMDFLSWVVKELNITQTFGWLSNGDKAVLDAALVSASITVNTETGKVESFLTKGLITLWEIKFECSFNYPSRQLICQLKEDQKITIAGLVKSISGVEKGMEIFNDFGLGSCSLAINLKKKTYSALCTLDGDLSFGPFTLKLVELSVDIDEKGTSMNLGGIIGVSKDKHLSLGARYDHKIEEWILTGNISGEENITLKELLELLRNIPDFPPLPDFLACISMEYLNLEYHLRQKKLLYEICGKLSLPVPINVSEIPFLTQVLPKKIDYEDNGLVLSYENGIVTEGSLRIEYPLKKETEVKQETTKLQQTNMPIVQASTAENSPNKVQVSEQGDNDKIHWLEINRQLGPAYLNKAGIRLDGSIAGVEIVGSVSIGPLKVELLGLWAGYDFAHSCVKGGLEGLGITCHSSVFSLGGSLYKMTPETENLRLAYGGSILVQTAKWQIAGIGSYSLLQDGTCSFFLFVRFMAPLGGVPAFQIQGLMGGLGINKSLKLPKVEEVEKFPLLNMQLGTGQAVLSKLEEGNDPWLKPSKGNYWAAVGIEFTSFGLVYGKMLLAILLEKDISISLLGTAEVTLPKGKKANEAYAYLKILLIAVLKPEEGTLTIDAALSQQSFLLSKKCRIQGGAAFYMWFGSHPHAGDFVLTVGGYHPDFKYPEHYPSVERVGFQWSESNSVSIKGEAYMALTPSCIMAGGRLEFLYASGIVKAWFIAYADLLIQWHPFWFDVRIGVEIGVAVRLNLLFCHKTITLSLGADLQLWGPSIGGKAKIHLSIISFTIGFGADKRESEPLTWKGFSDVLPAGKKNQILAQSGFEPVEGVQPWVVRGASLCILTETVIPQGTINIRPMGLTNINSIYNIILKDASGNVKSLDDVGLVSEEVKGRFPKALWGNPKESVIKAPMTVDVISGYRITQRPFEASGEIISDTLIRNFDTSNPLTDALKRQESFAFIPKATKNSLEEIKKLENEDVRKARIELCLQLAAFYQGPEGTYSKLKEDLVINFTDAPQITEGGI